MSAYERREQLIRVGRHLFSQQSLDTLSVEEIASAAKVSKPIIYEHFGGKEGLYAVVVDRELQTMSEYLKDFFAHPLPSERQTMERGVLTFLTYVEQHNEGFHVLLRDSPSTDPVGSLNTLLMTVSVKVEKMLVESFKRAKLPTKGAPYYANMIVGLTVFSAEMWADNPRISKEELAAYIVNMAWYGMRGIDAKPQLYFEGKEATARREKQQKDAEKQRARELKRAEKEAQKEARAEAKAEARAEAKAKANGAAAPVRAAATNVVDSLAVDSPVVDSPVVDSLVAGSSDEPDSFDVDDATDAIDPEVEQAFQGLDTDDINDADDTADTADSNE